MAQGHVHYPTLSEGFHVAQVLADGIAILDAEHDAAFSLVFQFPEVVGGPGDINCRAVLGCHLLYLGENLVGLGGGVLKGCLGALLLLQIGYHDGGIKVAFCHLVEVNQHLGVARVEVNSFGEEHGGVAMAVEREDFAVQRLGLLELCALAHKPLEDAHHVVVVT